jgi:hypothetical protein
MKRMAVALTFGMCAVSARAPAEPKAAPPSSHAKERPAPKSERRAYVELVTAADTDEDAEVSPAELEALVARGVERQVASRFGRLDRNGDGRVVPREVPSMLPERFRRFDRNGDGSFTLAELASSLLAQAKARCRAAFARLDHDRDGELSVADAESVPTRVAKR